MTFGKLFGQRVKVLRELRGLSQAELAEKLGLKKNSQYVSRIETGDRNPAFEMIPQIANALDAPELLLFDFDSDTTDPKVLRNEIIKLLRVCDIERLRHVRRYVQSLI